MHPTEPTRLSPGQGCNGSPITAWAFPAKPEAPVVIAIADFTASGLWFGDLAAACGDGVRVVAPDLAGRAASAAAPPATTLDEHVADILAVAGRVDATTFTLVGHGTGALVALAVTAAQPARIRSVIVLDGPPVIRPAEADAWMAEAALVDPGALRLGRTYAHRDALMTDQIASGRLPKTGMSRALRRAVDAEVTGSGFGWRAQLRGVTLQRDWQALAAWPPPPPDPEVPIGVFRARHGHLLEGQPIHLVDLGVEVTVLDTTHAGLLWAHDAMAAIAQILGEGA